MNIPESLFATFGLLVGPWLFYRGFVAWRIRQLIRSTPTARIRSMAIGFVELNGVVERRSRVTGPFSGRECAFWEVDVATRSGGKRGESEWTVVHRESSGNPFYLRDNTGVALVYPQGADLRTSFGVEEKTAGLGVPQMYMDYMESQNLGMRHLWSVGVMRFRERVLDEGAIVFVLGRANPKAMSQSLSDEHEMEEGLQATGTDAWAGRCLRDTDREVTAVVRRGERDPVYLISPGSERFSSLEFGLKAFAGLFGGPAITLFALWCVLELIKSREYIFFQ